MEAIGHPVVPFHFITHQEVLWAKAGFTELHVVMTIITNIVNLIAARPLHKQELSILLQEVESIYNRLRMHSNVRWLSWGKILERFVERYEEIKLDIENKHLEQLPEFNDCT